MSHTPGPWEIGRDRIPRSFIVHLETHLVSASPDERKGPQRRRTDPRTEIALVYNLADARLIKVAPELLRLGIEAATLLEDWATIIHEHNLATKSDLNTGTLKGTARRFRAAIAEAADEKSGVLS